MTAEVISPFSCSAALVDKPLKNVVETLKAALVRAKRGEIRGIALAYIDGAATVALAWSTGDVSANLMVSATAQLAYRTLVAHFDD